MKGHSFKICSFAFSVIKHAVGVGRMLREAFEVISMLVNLKMLEIVHWVSWHEMVCVHVIKV